jgi:hypothetical protein
MPSPVPTWCNSEIAVGMNDRVANKLRDFVRAAINARSGRQGFAGRNVADCAANVGKEFLSFQPIRSWLSGRTPTPMLLSIDELKPNTPSSEKTEFAD